MLEEAQASIRVDFRCRSLFLLGGNSTTAASGATSQLFSLNALSA